MVPIGKRVLALVDRYLAEVRHMHAIGPDDGVCSLPLTAPASRWTGSPNA
jgi:hypothetical protein